VKLDGYLLDQESSSLVALPHQSPYEDDFQPGPERREEGGVARIEIAGAVEWCVATATHAEE